MAINKLCNDTFISDSFLKNEVVVMEDDPNIQNLIKNIIIDELKWQVTPVKNKSEVVKLVHNKEAAFYILDITMGKDREQEGLDALEEIKSIDKKVFVSVFSAHPRYLKQAEKLEANLFQEKSSELREDVLHIAYEMLNYQLKIIDSIRQNILDKLNFINKIEQQYRKAPEDINIAAYEQLQSDNKWLEQYTGKYVAFVDGDFVDSDVNKQDLLDRLKDSKYEYKSRFIAKIKNDIRVIDMPSSLWLDIIR